MTSQPPPWWAPRYWPGHLLVLVLVAAAVWLGTWQWDAWQARRDAEARDLTRADAGRRWPRCWDPTTRSPATGSGSR